MFQISPNSRIIENVVSLSKESFFHPFRIEFTIMHQYEKEVHYIKDERNDHSDYIQPGPVLEAFLDILVEEKITSYPYEWLNVNKDTPIDEIDFFTDDSVKKIETTPDFMRYLREQGFIEDEIIYEESKVKEWVHAPHLIKMQLTFEKTSDVSTLSFQMFSRYPVNLASLVSERDLMGTHPPEVIDLNTVSTSVDGDTVTILFAKPIYSKRLTFVLAQYNADSNSYSTNNQHYNWRLERGI